MPHRISLSACLIAGLATPSLAGDLPTAGAAGPAPAPTVTSVRELLTAPLVDATAEPGAIWVRGRDQRLRFGEEGMTVLPVFGPASPQEWPVHVAVTGASLGGAPLDFASTGAPETDGTRVVQARGAFDEVVHLGLDAVEQTFVFATLPGAGDLVVELGVETELQPYASRDLLRFEHPTLGHVEVGGAFVLDAAGRRLEIERRWTGAGIALTVPGDFVATATLPLTIDPLWFTFASGFGVADDARPDVAYGGVSNEFLVVWEEYTSQQNKDVYATKWDSNLTVQGGALAIDMTSDSWTGPAVAYAFGYDRFLVAASVGLGTNQSRVEGRFVDVQSLTTVGAPFAISSTGGTQKSFVDVGGSNASAPSSSRFAVTWQRVMGFNDADVEYRVLEPDGTFSTPITSVDDAAVNDVQPSISTGLGDTALAGDSWHITFVRDNDGDGMGQVRAKRLYFTGSAASSSPDFLVDAGDRNAWPSVSSQLDEALPGVGSRPAVIAYERHENDPSRPSGLQSDLRVAIVAAGQIRGGAQLTRMEDVDRFLLQAKPSVATDGRTVFVAYLEEDPALVGGDSWNVHYASGEVRRHGPSPHFALGERHVLLAGTSDSELPVQIVHKWEGEIVTSSTDLVAVWTRDLASAPSGFGRIEGARFNYILPKTSTYRAVGVQYGDANPNSVSPSNSSWLRILGDQNRTSLHLAQARDLPPNSFGYLIASRTTGSVNQPGASQGRLLLGGDIGRFVSQIESSGANGTIDVTFDPLSIPQPLGAEAANPNETWNFQLWHRDSVGGQATSNFTNACAVTFIL